MAACFLKEEKTPVLYSLLNYIRVSGSPNEVSSLNCFATQILINNKYSNRNLKPSFIFDSSKWENSKFLKSSLTKLKKLLVKQVQKTLPMAKDKDWYCSITGVNMPLISGPTMPLIVVNGVSRHINPWEVKYVARKTKVVHRYLNWLINKLNDKYGLHRLTSRRLLFYPVATFPSDTWIQQGMELKLPYYYGYNHTCGIQLPSVKRLTYLLFLELPTIIKVMRTLTRLKIEMDMEMKNEADRTGPEQAS